MLTRIANDPQALRRVAERALCVAHFQPQGEGWQVDQLVDTDETCEAGCYRCLLSYSNQMDHRVIRRKNTVALDLLCRLTQAGGNRGSGGRDPTAHYRELERLSGSSLEKAWLARVQQEAYRLPDKAPYSLEIFQVRPDFAYGGDSPALVFIDGPHHATDHQQRIDEAKTIALRDAGYEVIRFPPDPVDWPAIFAAYPDVFGQGRSA